MEVGVNEKDGKTRLNVKDENVVFSINTLQTLFLRAELSLKRKLISISKNSDVHSGFVETEPKTDTAGKATWVKCQAYNYLAESNDETKAFNELHAEMNQKKE